MTEHTPRPHQNYNFWIRASRVGETDSAFASQAASLNEWNEADDCQTDTENGTVVSSTGTERMPESRIRTPLMPGGIGNFGQWKISALMRTLSMVILARRRKIRLTYLFAKKYAPYCSLARVCYISLVFAVTHNCKHRGSDAADCKFMFISIIIIFIRINK